MQELTDIIIIGTASIIIYKTICFLTNYFYYSVNNTLPNPFYKLFKHTGRKYIENKINTAKSSIAEDLKINLDYTPTLTIPENGFSNNRIVEHLDYLQTKDCDWENGKAFGYVYHGGKEHFDLLNNIHRRFIHTNPLHTSAFQSVRILEAEVVRMTANMLNGNAPVCGHMTSGGTESILLAVKAAKDFFLSKYPNKHPEIICCNSVHAAFVKAASYFNIKIIFTRLDNDYKSNPTLYEKFISKNTMMIVASAPCYPFGVIDRIEELSKLAKKYDVWLHVDACLGGFILPWLTQIGYDIPPFDFRLDGVSSMSCDVHKYGFTSKGASVILYKNSELRRFQYFTWSNWTGGLFASPSILGSRAGSSIAQAWASMVYMGKNNYIKTAKNIIDTTHKLIDCINKIDEINIIGHPKASVFAIQSTTKKLDIFVLGDLLEKKGWFIEKQQNPNSLHFTMTRNQVPIIDTFIDEFKTTIQESLNVKPFGKSAIYGNAVTIPDKELINDILIHYTGLVNDTVDHGGSLSL